MSLLVHVMFYPFCVRFLSLYCIHCLFSLFTCSFVTCEIQYQSINQSLAQDVELNELRATISSLGRHNYSSAAATPVLSGTRCSSPSSTGITSSSAQQQQQQQQHHGSSDSVRSESATRQAAHGVIGAAADQSTKKHKSWVRSVILLHTHSFDGPLYRTTRLIRY